MGNKKVITIDPWFLLWAAMAVMVLPIQWVFGWMGAAAIHELFHCLALRAVGCKVLTVRVRPNGTQIETDVDTNKRQILCALAGPLGGFLLLLFVKFCPCLAICGCFQSLYNLIPIYPLDGGRALLSALEYRCGKEKASIIASRTANVFLLALLVICFYALLFLRLGILPLFFALSVLFKNKKVKFTCKERLLRFE